MLRLLALTLCLLLAACANVPAPADRPITVLISIDGFRADYLDRGVTPNIAALAADGARAEAMRPSYPSLTFPNHYTLVTGLRPDRHGVVDNNMEDARRPGVVFSMAKTEVVHDPFWWEEAVPLWVTAERAGVRTATMFWPGSDLPIHGARPQDWKLYDKTLPADQRVDQLLAWLDRPPGERPGFATLYFDEVDTAGHTGGPDSPEVNAALTRTDAAVGRLVAALKAKGLFERTNLVIVADHGMAPIAPARITYLEDLMPTAAYQAVSVGSGATIKATPGREAEVAQALLAAHAHMTCWRKGYMPPRFDYGQNPRVPPFVCLAETGWLILPVRGREMSNKGAHGFDPLDPLMAVLFVGHGPAFRRGVVVPAFDNVDVYPLLARLVGVRPAPNDGDLNELGSALVR